MMHCPISFNDDLVDISIRKNRGILTEVHLADLHFNAIDPKIQYDILSEQVLSKINAMNHIDLISINGDIFDRKIMSNSNGALYASLFIDNIISIARNKIKIYNYNRSVRGYFIYIININSNHLTPGRIVAVSPSF